jgi:glycosyltransferase involved in cell wall biosynthesis
MSTAKMENTPIRVMFVISGLNRGGAESYLVQLVSTLDRFRFQPSICVLHTGTLIAEVPEDVPVFANLATWAGDIRVLPRLVRFFRTQSPTIVDTHGRGDGALWGRLASRLAGVPVIIQSLHHGRFSAVEDPKYALYHVLNRLLDPYTDAFVAVSQSQRAFYAKIGLSEGRIAVIYNGIDVDRFNPGGAARTAARQRLGLPLETPVIGMVANFSPVKRHDMLLQALTQVREKLPDVRCLLIGDGVLRVTVEGMAQQMGLSEMVVFFGSRSDVPDLLPAIDVLALTSDSESFSNAIVEAMASGKPVVATDCGGPAEIVVEGETGFLVPPGQPVILAEKITLLLQSPILAQQMGQAGRRRAIQCFGLERMIAAREALFLRLVDRKGVSLQ